MHRGGEVPFWLWQWACLSRACSGSSLMSSSRGQHPSSSTRHFHRRVVEPEGRMSTWPKCQWQLLRAAAVAFFCMSGAIDCLSMHFALAASKCHLLCFMEFAPWLVESASRTGAARVLGQEQGLRDMGPASQTPQGSAAGLFPSVCVHAGAPTGTRRGT